MGDYVIAYTLDGEGEEVIFQHGVAVRMAILGAGALALLSGCFALWRRWRRRRRNRAAGV
jgi:quinoprotein glucose dehydrogenase